MKASGDRLGAGRASRTATDDSARSAGGLFLRRVSVSLSWLRDSVYSVPYSGRRCEGSDVRYYSCRLG